MFNLYMLILIILFILAVSDLIVGISNDASNFLNSAIGSKAAPLKVILAIAGAGVITGATFSNGMMEIARSGIFYPEMFYFSDIMLIFLAVMITDILLLDTFNTLGLPTSTTVSIVFELLGAAVGITLVKLSHSPETIANIGNYINSSKALAIISGILLSVVIAFLFGMIIQFITRAIFSFDYQRYVKYLGGIWGGIVITAIVYFMLVKGAKGASFMTPEIIEWLKHNSWKILLYSFTGISVILQLLITFFNINIFKIIVLVGTFSLAMAFAGNDMVNFIGVPLAGLESYKELLSHPDINPESLLMGSLAEPVKTPTILLLIAGLIMVATLFFSKKSRTVSQTEINLARQSSGDERFNSTSFSRTLVRGAGKISSFFNKVTPEKVKIIIARRFDEKLIPNKSNKDGENSSFDLLRASVNMFVASILIATGTSLKLPLSTTYVTFMVAMGTSLADKAWGRESAVYRITGVLTVIGGWFFTALIAFIVSMVVVLFLNRGGIVAIIISITIAIFFLIRSNILHKKKSEGKKLSAEKFKAQELAKESSIVSKCNESISDVIESIPHLYSSTLQYLIKEDRKNMKKIIAETEELNRFTKELKYNIYSTLKKLEEKEVETGHNYVQVLDYLREIAHCLTYLAEPVYEHLDNHHPPLIKEQIKDISDLNKAVILFYEHTVEISNEQHFEQIDNLIAIQQAIFDLINRIKKKQIKYIKNEQVGTKTTLLYLNLLEESKNLMLHTVNMAKAHRDFILSEKRTGKHTPSISVKI